MYVNFPIYQLTFVVCRVLMICTLVFYINGNVFVVFKVFNSLDSKKNTKMNLITTYCRMLLLKYLKGGGENIFCSNDLNYASNTTITRFLMTG